ncbi:hypothetical protein [Deinococcus navajonensis]|uniref:HD domain-containing protein n=1 Tax=Deinococcus navajonensis TaxID=309884 RepID=A0ABV8XJQ4_9DEIO
MRSCALLELGEHVATTWPLREQVRASRANGDRVSGGAGLHDLGVLHTRGDAVHAEAYLRAALATSGSTGDVVGRASCTWSLGDLGGIQPARALEPGGPAGLLSDVQRLNTAALDLYHQSLTWARRAAHVPMGILVLLSLGELALTHGTTQEGEAPAPDAAQEDHRPLWIRVPPLAHLLLHEDRRRRPGPCFRQPAHAECADAGAPGRPARPAGHDL